MGGNFLGALAGEIGQHIHERHIQDYNAAIQSKQNTLDAYKALGSDPHMQDMWGQIAQAQLQAAAADPRKFMGGKIPKDLDPQQWFQLQSQRSMGLSPSPANQGQNPTSIPAPAAGQMPGQAQQAMPWNAYQQNTDDPGAPGQGAPAGGAGPIPPPPGVSASPPPNAPSASQGQATMPGGMINRTGSSVDGTPSMAQPNQPGQPPGMGGVGPSSNGANVGGPSPQVAALAGGTAAQSIQALPPNPAAGGAPSSVTAVSPSQAAAIMPPPPVAAQQQNSSVGPHILSSEELFQRQLAHQTALSEAEQAAQMHRMQGEAAFNTEQENIKLQNHVRALKSTVDPSTGKSVWDGMTPREQAAVVSGVATLGTMPRILPAMHDVPGASAPPGQIDAFGNALDPKGVYNVRPNPATGEQEWFPKSQTAVGKKIEWGQDPEDKTREIPYQVDNAGNKTPIEGVSRLKTAMLGSQHSLSSSTDASGNTTSISTTRKVVPGAGGALMIPPPPGVSTAPLSAGGGGGAGGGTAAVRPEIQRYAEDKRDGKSPTIPAKDQDPVTKYMVQQGWATPTALSAKGAGEVAAIDPVLTQVNDLLARLKDRKDDGNPLSLVTNYQLYKKGFSTPDNDLFTNLSFERIRSAAAALKGTNARAYQIVMQAFDHTPTLERAGGFDPDSPKAMYGKLMEMQKLLKQGRNSVLADEKKSGVIGKPDESGSANAPPPTSVVDDLIKQYK